jgi:hypothetical protein
MKTLLSGMPYSHSTERRCVQETWRKYGWKPAGEKNVQHARFGHKHANVGHGIRDDYDMVQSQDWMEMGGFK